MKVRLPLPLRELLKAAVRRWPFPYRVRLSDGRRIYVDLSSPVGLGIAVTGTFAEPVREAITAHCKPAGVFIDVGSNVGYYALSAANVVGDRGEVHCFEVAPRALRCLRRTADEVKDVKFIVHPYAVGDQPTAIQILLADDIAHTRVARALTANAIRVPMLPLDVWLPYFEDKRIDVVKIDVEGFELAVLRGAERLLRRHRPVVICEANESLAAFGHSKVDLEQFFSSLEYTVREIRGAADGDLLCLPLSENAT